MKCFQPVMTAKIATKNYTYAAKFHVDGGTIRLGDIVVDGSNDYAETVLSQASPEEKMIGKRQFLLDMGYREIMNEKLWGTREGE